MTDDDESYTIRHDGGDMRKGLFIGRRSFDLLSCDPPHGSGKLKESQDLVRRKPAAKVPPGNHARFVTFPAKFGS